MKHVASILAVMFTLLLFSGCGRINDFKITSCSIASLSPSGLKGVKAVLKVGVLNPLMNLTVSDVQGVINNNGVEFANFSAGKLPIAKKCEKVYPLSCSGALSKNVGLADLLKLAAARDFSGMTMDISLKVKLKCGIGKTLRFKDIKISELMEPSVAAAWVDLIVNELAI
mgnify:CR=1 FL=1